MIGRLPSFGVYSLQMVILIRHLCVFMVVLQHLLFSVTEPQYRSKPAGVSDVSSIWLKFSFQYRHPGFFPCFLLGVFGKCDELVWIARLCGQRQWANLKAWRVLIVSACGLSLFTASRISPSGSRYFQINHLGVCLVL